MGFQCDILYLLPWCKAALPRVFAGEYNVFDFEKVVDHRIVVLFSSLRHCFMLISFQRSFFTWTWVGWFPIIFFILSFKKRMFWNKWHRPVAQPHLFFVCHWTADGKCYSLCHILSWRDCRKVCVTVVFLICTAVMYIKDVGCDKDVWHWRLSKEHWFFQMLQYWKPVAGKVVEWWQWYHGSAAAKSKCQ